MSAEQTPIDSIKIGDRDRTDFGDVAELAASIARVGLLHPVVVTANGDLVAGDRRLAAVRSLGWTHVPTTVAKIETLAEILQAEADENTCRKGLTPYEAARARRRRVELLAPKAAKAKMATQAKPGERVGASKLDRPTAPAVGAVRKVAAVGTGYSGSTLDKVDEIARAAEQGVVKVARVVDGREKRVEVPAPPKVVEVAKKALEDVKKTGAAIDRSSKDVAAAVEAYVATDPSVQRARFMKSFSRAEQAFVAITEFSPDDVAAALDPDEMGDLESSVRVVNQWLDKVREARPTRLRVIGGK